MWKLHVVNTLVELIAKRQCVEARVTTWSRSTEDTSDFKKSTRWSPSSLDIAGFKWSHFRLKVTGILLPEPDVIPQATLRERQLTKDCLGHRSTLSKPQLFQGHPIPLAFLLALRSLAITQAIPIHQATIWLPSRFQNMERPGFASPQQPSSFCCFFSFFLLSLSFLCFVFVLFVFSPIFLSTLFLFQGT